MLGELLKFKLTHKFSTEIKLCEEYFDVVNNPGVASMCGSRILDK